MNFSKISPKTWLLLILIIGFILRSVNLTIGFPILYLSNDEAIYHLSALNMLAEKTPFTIGNYGPLGAYIQIPFLFLAFLVLLVTDKVSSVSDMEFLIVTHEGYFLFIPRIISAMFGTLTILVAYKLAKELFKDTRIALYSALLTALSFNLVFISHQARAWAPAIFFSMLSIYHIIKYSKSFKRGIKDLLLSVLFASISFGFHQFGGLISVLIFLTTINLKLSIKKYLHSVAPTFLFGLILIALFNFLSLRENFFQIFNPKNESIELVRSLYRNLTFNNLYEIFIQKENFLFWRGLLFTDLIIVLLAFVILFKKQYEFNYKKLFVIFILFNLFLSTFIFPPLMRYFLIAFALLPVLAGYAFYNITAKYKNIFSKIIIIFLILYNSIYFNILILNDGTFNQLRKWVDDNVSPDTPIISASHRNVGYVPNAIATQKIRRLKPGYYSRAVRLVGNQYTDNVRFIIYADEQANATENKIATTLRLTKDYNSNIVIDHYYRLEDRLFNMKTEYDFELLAHFSPTGDKIFDTSISEALFDSSYLFPSLRLQRPGPYIDILKVKN